jgi:diketogulonate reductase-like aldo/keto reductase
MMPTNRRRFLELGMGAGAALLLDALPSLARAQSTVIRKPIPSSGEQIPVIGLGSAGTFNLTPSSPDYPAGRAVIRLFHELGGKVIDTAPSYQRSEQFIGETVQALDLQDDLFLATKVNVGGAGKNAALQQMEQSSRVFGKRTVDLMQVWNLGDSIRSLTDDYLPMHMEAVTEWKRSGRCRYIGITTSRDPQYDDVEAAMLRYTLDFVQLDYSIGDRTPEQRLLPLARERGIAVLANRPFTTGNLFRLVAGRRLPEWASEFDCGSWAQFFLKYIVSHPAVTCAIPATGDVAHLRDNMGAGMGRLPDDALRARMAELFSAL